MLVIRDSRRLGPSPLLAVGNPTKVHPREPSRPAPEALLFTILGEALLTTEGPGVHCSSVLFEWASGANFVFPRRHLALELVSGADFWCKLMSRASPGDLGEPRGRFSA